MFTETTLSVLLDAFFIIVGLFFLAIAVDKNKYHLITFTIGGVLVMLFGKDLLTRLFS